MKARIALFTAIASVVALSSLATAQEPYKLPPKVVVDILDAPPTPTILVSPARDRIAIVEREAMPTIADLAQPVLRLAGARINPRNYGPYAGARTTGITIKSVLDRRADVRVQVPANASLIGITWSPDGRQIAFGNRALDRVDLYVADALSGQARKLDVQLNATAPLNICSWADNSRMLCRIVANVGPPPAAPNLPAGPIIQESTGQKAPVRTYEDLLTSPYDETLYEHYFTSQLALVDVVSGAVTKIGRPAIFLSAQLSPDDNYVLVTRVRKPFSYQVPQQSFPRTTEVWNMNGEVARLIAEYPLDDDRPTGYVTPLPRSASWRANEPATLIWVRALDEGNPRNKADFRDEVLMQRAPFNGQVAAIAKLQQRYRGIAWTQDGLAFVDDYERAKRWQRTYLINPEVPGKLTLVWERSSEDAYKDPGNFVFTTASRAPSIVQRGDFVYLAGSGASPAGDRPFLDRLSLRTLSKKRLWQADDTHYETFVALLDDDARRFITRRESNTEAPNYFIRLAKSGKLAALTNFPDPAPQLAGITRQLVRYKRADGVDLSATLYLPAGYKPGTRLPVVMWAYPLEFASADVAGQVRGSPNQFTRIAGPSHLFFLTQGYAVFDNPSIPIVGGDTANNTYVEQLVAGAKAAVDKVVELGVGDRDRIGIGGHSYGAFMTANLLAHSDLFRAGIARSGAYNRTLTPFGFQSEERTYWEVPELYNKMSPFNYAHKINEPLLMIHGMADDNSGTFPIQSERMYAAIKGHGGTVRFVYLPYEAHGYSARESVLDVVAEMVSWFDKYVKNPAAKAAATFQERGISDLRRSLGPH